jgi:uncharacterized protein (TIGR02118 family)
MIKVMLFVRRKEGFSREAFRERYEAGHVPLAIRELEHLRRYARNFVKPMKGQPEPEFDVVTEFWFEDWDAWKATSAYALGAETGRTLAEDEAIFMDRASMRFLVVEEHVSDVDAVRARQASPR